MPLILRQTLLGTFLCLSASDLVAAEKSCRQEAANRFDPSMSQACEMGCATKLKYTEDMVVKQPGASIGDLTRCPVSGVVFKVTGSSAKVSFQGSRYYTCCGGCAAKFNEKPESFVTLVCQEVPKTRPRA